MNRKIKTIQPNIRKFGNIILVGSFRIGVEGDSIMRLFPVCVFQRTHTLNIKSNYTTSATNQDSVVENAEYTPRRAIMYCPGDDLRKVNKGLNSGADSIALDCEDGVALSRKKEARETIRSVLDGGDLPTCRPEVGVRVNSVDSGLCDDDLATVMSGDRPATTLLLPKVQSKDELTWFGERLDKYLKRDSLVKLIMYAESAKAIMDLPEICRAAIEMSTRHKFRPVALVLGSDDLCASVGTARSVDGAEIMYARQRLVLVAKAFGFQAIDMVHIQYKDLDSLRVQSEAGARLGYTGKQVIHPDQIDVVQRAFLPSEERLRWAREVVGGFQQSQQQGKGAFVHKGSMVDMPLLRQAENILRLMNLTTNTENCK